MPLPWYRMDSNWPSNPKVARLAAAGQWHAIVAWDASIAYANSHGTDGKIEPVAFPFIHCDARTAKQIVAARLWTEIPDGYLINGFDEYQQLNAITEAKHTAARVASRKANCVRHHGEDCGCWKDTPGG